MKAFLLDGYVDEPACFGVPPYISPYIRYCAGVLLSHSIDVRYATCDQWRKERQVTAEALAEADLLIVVMGLTVPGRYRGGSPLTLGELGEIAQARRYGKMILAGPVHNGYALRGGVCATQFPPELIRAIDFIAAGDPEAALDQWLRTGIWNADATRSYEWLDRIAPLGAEIVKQHPFYPEVIAEMEISRGCDRMDGKCSFCTEGAGRVYEERSALGTAREFAALDRAGVTAFRLGRCSNILAWGGERTTKGIRPSAANMETLYASLREAAANLRILHTDNCNPATVARFPAESRACLEAIVRHNTCGDGLSLGIESMDPVVRKANCLKVSLEEAVEVVRMINEAGFLRPTPNALPALLPGLNFLSGLAGETREWNQQFLQILLRENLAVRRINIRRAIVFPGSRLAAELAENPSRTKDRDYRRWREWVREEVDPVMLERVAPDGTILRDVIAEERSGNVVFGRPLGSYPPLVGIVSPTLKPGEKRNVMVTDRGSRSLTGVAWPLDANHCTKEELMALPGLGKARVRFLLSHRPYGSAEALKKTLERLDAPGIVDSLMPYFRQKAED